MLKITGICLMVAGAALFILTLVRGRQNNIRSQMKELSMILSSGYGSERTPEEKKASPFEGKTPIAATTKKKRVLSEEARSILEMVERDREKEALETVGIALPSPEFAPEKNTPKKGTAVLPENPKKGTATLPVGTEDKPRKRGAAVLSSDAKKAKGTAVLREEPPARKGTAVLLDQNAGASQTPKRKGTAVLISGDANTPAWSPKKKGTAVLDEEGPHARSIKSEKKGTAVLMETNEEAVPARKGAAVLKEEGGN